MGLAIGVDIGGTGIKAAMVDVDTGRLQAPAHSVPTPRPGTPDEVGGAVREVVAAEPAGSPVGIGYPGAIKNGRAVTAAHVDDSWIGADVEQVFSRWLAGRRFSVLNDADAAGIAEARYGAAAGRSGVVVVVTLGTGIGTAVLHDGVLLPNTEFGHMEVNGADAELLVSGRLRREPGMTWGDWGARLGRYLEALEHLIWPDLFVIGGGISVEFERFRPHLNTRADIVPAALGNAAGIVGAALMADEREPIGDRIGPVPDMNDS